MVAYVVRHLHLSVAGLGRVVGVDLDAVLRVPHVEQQDVKVEDGVRRDDVAWGGEESRSFKQALDVCLIIERTVLCLCLGQCRTHTVSNCVADCQIEPKTISLLVSESTDTHLIENYNVN